MDQRSPEWFSARLGKVTASRIADVCAKTKSGVSATRTNYMTQLIVETLTQQPTDGFTSREMEWGTEQEPFARAAYSARVGQLVDEVGFIPHPTILGAGASPDGISGAGLVEIKCPNTATHLEWLLSEKIPSKYRMQMQWQMACTKAAWCDFVSYDPRLPAHLQLLIINVPRDDAEIKNLEGEVNAFLAEMEEKLGKLKRSEND